MIFALLVSLSVAASNLWQDARDMSSSRHFSKRVGLEIELTHLEPRAVAAVLLERFGGRMETREAVYSYRDPQSGQERQHKTLRYKIKDSKVGVIWIKPEENIIHLAEYLRTLPVHPVVEIVTAPLHVAQVQLLAPVLQELKGLGAQGTSGGHAVSLQVNVEMGQGQRHKVLVEDVVSILKLYLSEPYRSELAKDLQVPEFRAKYLGLPPQGFLKRLSRVDYRPTWDQLYTDAMYRASLEHLGHAGAWTLSDAEASRELKRLVDRLGFESLLPVMKWNFLRYSSLMMFMKPDEWLSKALEQTQWFKPHPILEFREPNNEFDVGAVYSVLGLVASAQELGTMDAPSVREHLRQASAWQTLWSSPNTDFPTEPWRLREVQTLTPHQLDKLRRGTSQRARALDQFLSDALDGRPTPVPQEVMDRLWRDSLARPLRDFRRPQENHFVYGPDVTQSPQGDFLVMEDQNDLVTGLDIVDAYAKRYLKQLPEEAANLVHKPERDHFFGPWLRSSRPMTLVRYATPAWLKLVSSTARNYDAHWSRVAERLGIANDHIVQVGPRGLGSSLQVKAQGVFVGDHRIDFILSAVKTTHLYSWASPHLGRAYRDRLVEVSHSPGAQLIDSKLLLPYVDLLIHHYLKEPVILPTIKSEFLLSSEQHAKVWNQPERFVFKSTHPNSAGGRGIIIPAKEKISDHQLADIRRQIERDPFSYLVQEYVEPTGLAGHIIDYRVLVHKAGADTTVAELPVSRASPKDKAKTNISGNQAGKYVAVLCAKALTLASQP